MLMKLYAKCWSECLCLCQQVVLVPVYICWWTKAYLRTAILRKSSLASGQKSSHYMGAKFAIRDKRLLFYSSHHSNHFWWINTWQKHNWIHFVKTLRLRWGKTWSFSNIQQFGLELKLKLMTCICMILCCLLMPHDCWYGWLHNCINASLQVFLIYWTLRNHNSLLLFLCLWVSLILLTVMQLIKAMP